MCCFFKQKTAYEMRISDWSSDVCSSDLLVEGRRTKGGLMARRVFFSFHFANDFWRTQQVRNIGALEGQSLCTANAWEEVKRKGKASIEKWIDDNMYGKICVVVLVGSETANRPWVIREIVKGCGAGKEIGRAHV